MITPASLGTQSSTLAFSIHLPPSESAPRESHHPVARASRPRPVGGYANRDRALGPRRCSEVGEPACSAGSVRSFAERVRGNGIYLSVPSVGTMPVRGPEPAVPHSLGLAPGGSPLRDRFLDPVGATRGDTSRRRRVRSWRSGGVSGSAPLPVCEWQRIVPDMCGRVCRRASAR